MRIACPECNAAYDVPATRLGPGRPVRCARCGAVWTPVATEDAEPPIPASFEPGPRTAAPDAAPAATAPPESAVPGPGAFEPKGRPAIDIPPAVPVSVPGVAVPGPIMIEPVMPEPALGPDSGEPAFDDVPDPMNGAMGGLTGSLAGGLAGPMGGAMGPPAVRLRPPRPARKRKGVPVMVGWLLTGFVLFVLVFLAVVRRDAVMAAWPPSERAYRLVGLGG